MFGSRNFLFAKSGGALVLSGKLFMWGENYAGRLGLGDTANRSSPVQVGSSTTWSQINTAYTTLAVNTDGELWAWGLNSYGTLG